MIIKQFLIPLLIIAGIVVAVYSERSENTQAHTPNSVTWYNCDVEVKYQNRVTDTVNIDVFDSPNAIYLNNGDLSYIKPTYATGGAVAGKAMMYAHSDYYQTKK